MAPKPDPREADQGSGDGPSPSSPGNTHTAHGHDTDVLRLLNDLNDIRYGRFRWLKPITERLFNDFKSSLAQLTDWRTRVNVLISRLESDGNHAKAEEVAKLFLTHPEFASVVHNPANFKASISLGHMNFSIIGSAAREGQAYPLLSRNPRVPNTGTQGQTTQAETQPDVSIITSGAGGQPTEQEQSRIDSLEISTPSASPPFAAFLPRTTDLGNTTLGKRWCKGTIPLRRAMQDKLAISLTTTGQPFVVSCDICPKIVVPLLRWDEEEIGAELPTTGHQNSPTHDIIQRHFQFNLTGDLADSVAHFEDFHKQEFRRGLRSIVRRYGAEVRDDCSSNIAIDRWSIAGHNASVDRWFQELMQQWEALRDEYRLFGAESMEGKASRIAKINRFVSASSLSQIRAETFYSDKGGSREEWVALCSDPTCMVLCFPGVLSEASKEHFESHGVKATDELDILLLFGFRVLRDEAADDYTTDSTEDLDSEQRGGHSLKQGQLKRQADSKPDVSRKRLKPRRQEEVVQQKVSHNGREGSVKADKPILDISKPFAWTEDLGSITKTTKKGYLSKFSHSNLAKACSDRGHGGDYGEKSKADLVAIIMTHDESYGLLGGQGVKHSLEQGNEQGTEQGSEQGTEQGAD